MLGSYLPKPFLENFFLGEGWWWEGCVEQGGGNQFYFPYFFSHMTKLFSFKKLKKPVIKFLDCGFSMEEETSQGHSSGC